MPTDLGTREWKRDSNKEKRSRVSPPFLSVLACSFPVPQVRIRGFLLGQCLCLHLLLDLGLPEVQIGSYQRIRNSNLTLFGRILNSFLWPAAFYYLLFRVHKYLLHVFCPGFIFSGRDKMKCTCSILPGTGNLIDIYKIIPVLSKDWNCSIASIKLIFGFSIHLIICNLAQLHVKFVIHWLTRGIVLFSDIRGIIFYNFQKHFVNVVSTFFRFLFYWAERLQYI